MTDTLFLHRLSCGLPVAAITIPGVRSVAVGVQVGAGSRFEDDDARGAARVLEYWTALGAGGFDARAFSARLEDWGCRKESAANVEWTRFWASLGSEGLPAVLRVLADAVCRPDLADQTFSAARNLVAAQAKGRPDDLRAYVWDRLRDGMAAGHRLGRPAGGRYDQLAALQPEGVRRAYRAMYRPGNALVAVAGEVNPARLVDLAEAAFDGWAPVAGDSGELPGGGRPDWAPAVVAEERDTLHCHLALGVPAVAYSDRDYYAMALITQALGGAGGSRLFDVVRERHGLAYQIRARLACHADSGLMLLYLGTHRERVEQALALVRSQLEQIQREGFAAAELNMARRQLLAQMVMRGESTVTRLHTLLTACWYQGHGRTLAELAAGISAVTAADVRRALDAHPLTAGVGVASVGPFSRAELDGVVGGWS